MIGASMIVVAVDTAPIIGAVVAAAGAVFVALLTTRWRRKDAERERADQELRRRHEDELAQLEVRQAVEPASSTMSTRKSARAYGKVRRPCW